MHHLSIKYYLYEYSTLQTVTVLRLFPHDVEHGINKLGSLGVVAFRPVVPCPGLAEDEVIGAEDLPVRPRSDAVHSAGLQIHEDGARDEAAAAGFVVVDIDALELQIVVAAVPPGGVDAVLRAHHLPEFRPNLVAALAALDVEDLTHSGELCVYGDGDGERGGERERI